MQVGSGLGSRSRFDVRARSVGLIIAALAVVSAGCTITVGSDPGGTTTTTSTTTIFNPPGEDPPVILSFGASTGTGSAPLTTAFQWTVVDADLDPLTCSLDLDNNGSFEVVVPSCGQTTIRSATFASPGARTITLSVTDGITPPVTSTTAVNVSAPSSDTFEITVRLNGSMTPSQSAAFTVAAARWSEVIRTGLSSLALNIPADDCGTGAPAFNATIDDVVIDASISAIDGVGGILGQAGPCYVRSGVGGLPVYGAMQFDVADVATLETNGQFNAVILHEMGHVLGIGTVWPAPLLAGAGSADPVFTGPVTNGAWQAIGGTGSVPVENSGGSGTADSHWRESVFNSELMTGYLDAGSTPLSAITIGSLADIGYGVDLSAADPYGLPGLRADRAEPGIKIDVRRITPRVHG